MTIHRNYGEVEFHCDVSSCHEVLETETRDWSQALFEFQKAGWSLRYISDEPFHTCPDCLENERPKL